VVGKPFENRLVAPYAHDAFDRTHRYTGRVQHTPLLDVQLHVSRERALGPGRVGHGDGVQARLGQMLGDQTAIRGHLIQYRRVEQIGHGSTAEGATADRRLLSAEVDHLDGMA
jgi:hypothetical protein